MTISESLEYSVAKEERTGSPFIEDTDWGGQARSLVSPETRPDRAVVVVIVRIPMRVISVWQKWR